MAILPIVTYGHPSLRKKAEPVLEGDDIRSFVDDMFHTMRNAQGIGLASNQVDVMKQVIVLDISEMEEYGDHRPLAIINPQIISAEGEWDMEEGCLSIPSVRDIVNRSEKIKIQYKDIDFRDRELEADGLLARVILHEIDHLNGILFIDHLATGRRKLHKGTLIDIKRGELEIPYPVVNSDEAS